MNPKFKVHDKVTFRYKFATNTENPLPRDVIGYVAIVDANGIFFDDSEPYYDIMVDELGLFKHIPEHELTLVS